MTTDLKHTEDSVKLTVEINKSDLKDECLNYDDLQKHLNTISVYSRILLHISGIQTNYKNGHFDVFDDHFIDIHFDRMNIPFTVYSFFDCLGITFFNYHKKYLALCKLCNVKPNDYYFDYDIDSYCEHCGAERK